MLIKSQKLRSEGKEKPPRMKRKVKKRCLVMTELKRKREKILRR